MKLPVCHLYYSRHVGGVQIFHTIYLILGSDKKRKRTRSAAKLILSGIRYYVSNISY